MTWPRLRPPIRPRTPGTLIGATDHREFSWWTSSGGFSGGGDSVFDSLPGSVDGRSAANVPCARRRVENADRRRSRRDDDSASGRVSPATARSARCAAIWISALASGGAECFKPSFSPLATTWSNPAAQYQSSARSSKRVRVVDRNASSAFAASVARESCRSRVRVRDARKVPASSSRGP